MLKSLTRVPPGGWQFFQAQIGWGVPPEVAMTTLDAAVDALHAVRSANHGRFPDLSLDKAQIKAEIINYTCIRLANNAEWCTGGPEPLPKTWRLPRQQRPAASESVAGAVEEPKKPGYITNATAGIGLYLDWFGEGRPVDQVTAEKRAGVCIGCPKHVRGSFAQRFNQAVAKEIMAVFEILHDLELKTSRDLDLAICDACDCPMKAKVWSPIDIINKHLRHEAREALWERCWILEESK